MRNKMDRSKRAVLFNNLPGQTYDFDRTGVIARTRKIRARQNTELNLHLVVSAVERSVAPWLLEQRPLFPTPLSQRAHSFVLLEPLSVEAEMFPLVFWCQNRKCGRVFDYSSRETMPPATCPHCKTGKLAQIRFVRTHRCGALLPLSPPYCKKCGTSGQMALDTRGSERISSFQWICRKCGETFSVFGGKCPQCSWSTPVMGVNRPEMMSVDVHRAGSTFYPHYVTLLNQPGRKLSTFLELDYWQEITAATYLQFPEVAGKELLEFARFVSPDKKKENAFNLDELRAQGFSEDQLDILRVMQVKNSDQPDDPKQIADSLIERTGLSADVWKRAGQEMLEAVLPLQSGVVASLFEATTEDFSKARSAARRMGFGRVSLISDFPITTATFGYSRSDYRPGRCYINPFPPDQDHNSKFPIFVDMVQADAIMMKLDPNRVIRWLERNGQSVRLPSGNGDASLLANAYFVQLFDNIELRETITDNAIARMVFSLLHSLSHLCVRRAALLCGLDRNSLNEYLLPKSLSFAVFSNHRFGATIGALTSLYEQSLGEWFNQVFDSRKCVYDPVCADNEGSCHACLHLAEISCQVFNLNLSRTFLFGGDDPYLGKIQTGYLDPSLERLE